MKKNRIRYSEFTPTPVEPATPIAPRRISTPVELARALAAARAAEAQALAPVVEKVVIPSDARSAGSGVIPSEARNLHGPYLPPVANADSSTSLEMTTATAELLLFTVGSERFAIPLADVEEAVDLPVIHFVPEMPAAMLGVVSLRGMLVPVYSPSAALGQSLGSRRAGLIFRLTARTVGVAVDDVEDAIIVDESDVQPLPASELDDLVLGVVHHEGQLISVMRAASLVAACRDARVVTTA
jgi:purine-binding chemotaxis protein CheW